MKRFIALYIIAWFAHVLFAQTLLDSLFKEASLLNDKKEYASAANLFSNVQTKALETDNMDLCLRALLAEGECYYMLEQEKDMSEIIEKAQSMYKQYSAKMGAMSRLLLQESISKLKGSYYSCLVKSDTTSYHRAENAYKNSLTLLEQLKKETMFDDEELEINVHRELLSLYYSMERYDQALEEADIVFEYRLNIGFDLEDKEKGVKDYDNFVDAYVSRAMVLARLNRFKEALEVLAEMPDNCDNESSVLRTKGKILMLQYAFYSIDNRKSAKEYYLTYINKFKQELSKNLTTLTDSQKEQYWLAMHDFLYDCYCLEGYAPDLLYDLALFSKGYLLECCSSKKSAEVSWTDIRKKLKPNECAIEFVQYNNYLNEKQLAALIIKKDCRIPYFIHINSVKGITLEQLRNKQTIETAITNDVAVSKDVLYSDTTLFKKIWTDEMISLIEDCHTIYFSPDGFLHQLAIEYMFPNQSVNCYRLSSTRKLMEANQLKIDNMLLCGGINYYANINSQMAGNDVYGYNMLKSKLIYINKLNATETEVDTIYKNSNNIDNLLLKGEQATDERLYKEIQNGYSAVHIATHGYFSGENKFMDLKPVYRDCSMSESGLLMAGVNDKLYNTNFNPIYSDGILTAKETSELDLTDVHLIVLSACQTGLGYITADGVYGIQRALKMAGAKAMVVSLWSVDDEATMEFMKMFYQELNKQTLNKTDVYKAFQKTRERMLNRGEIVKKGFRAGTLSSRETSKQINLPRYANAFILIDGL